MPRPKLPDTLPTLPDSPDVAAALAAGKAEAKQILLLAESVTDDRSALAAVKRLELAKIDWPSETLAKTMLDLRRALESKKKVPIETVRKAMRLIADAVPRMRRAHALKAEVLRNLAAAGVDMEARARLLESRRALALAAVESPLELVK